MSAALLRKELRDLLPWGVLSLAFGLSNVVQLFLEQVDSTPLGQTFFFLNQENVVLYWLIAFAIGTGLAIREHDDRTLAFLDGLPVSRSRVFFVKCAVMSLLVLVGPLLELVSIGALHLLSRGSLDRELHAALLAQALALQTLFIVNGLVLGAAFGRLRSLAWIAAGVTATALLLFINRVPRAAVLNPLTLLDWQWTTAAIVVDGEAVRTQLAVTALALVIAWRGFERAGKGRQPWNLSGPVASAVIAVATIATTATLVVVVMRPFEGVLPSGGDADGEGLAFRQLGGESGGERGEARPGFEGFRDLGAAAGRRQLADFLPCRLDGGSTVAQAGDLPLGAALLAAGEDLGQRTPHQLEGDSLLVPAASHLPVFRR